VLPAALSVASLTVDILEASGGTQVITQFAAFRCGGLAASIDRDWSDAEHA